MIYFEEFSTDFLVKLREEEQIKPQIYELYAVSQHSGGMGGGHYTAYALHGKQWYYFSDSYWKQVSPSDVLSSQAYLLFYRKKETSG